MAFIVVDASVLFACLAKDGRARDVLMTTRANLVAPPALLEEATALLPKAAERAGVTADVMAGVLAHLQQRIQVLSGEAYRSKRGEAQRACRQADAWGDDEYVALALALDAAIWTYDQDFHRIPGLRIAGTTEVDMIGHPGVTTL